MVIPRRLTDSLEGCRQLPPVKLLGSGNLGVVIRTNEARSKVLGLLSGALLAGNWSRSVSSKVLYFTY